MPQARTGRGEYPTLSPDLSALDSWDDVGRVATEGRPSGTHLTEDEKIEERAGIKVVTTPARVVHSFSRIKLSTIISK